MMVAWAAVIRQRHGPTCYWLFLRNLNTAMQIILLHQYASNTLDMYLPGGSFAHLPCSLRSFGIKPAAEETVPDGPRLQ
jgi:hypothetical protein